MVFDEPASGYGELYDPKNPSTNTVLSPLPPLLCPSSQIFEGNSNYDTPELRTVETLLTRFIRIYPERATPAGMGLRMELLGCEIEGKPELLLRYLLRSIAFSEFC